MAREGSYATSYEKTAFARCNGQLLCPSMQEHVRSHLKSGNKKKTADMRLKGKDRKGRGKKTTNCKPTFSMKNVYVYEESTDFQAWDLKIL